MSETPAQGLTPAQKVADSALPLHRYFGNTYVQAMAGQMQRLDVQSKLYVNDSGDIYEQEADRVADQVLAGPAHHEVTSAPPRIQRFSGRAQVKVDEAPASVHQALGSAGRPLEPVLRHDMERRFGQDFSSVRVHTGAAAEQSADDVNAYAYTVGHHIVLGADRSAAETHERRRVLAHELTHVVQQSSTDISTHQGTGQGGFFNRSISTAQPAAKTLQRKPKRPARDASVQPPVKGKPSRQTSSKKVPFAIHFDRPLTRNEFIELAEMTIYGRLTPGEWRGVPDRFKASDSPVTVWVPASMVEPELRGRIATLPAHIQKFLLANRGGAESYEDLQSVVNAGFLLEVAGVTEDELELSLLESPKTEPSDLVSWAEDFLVRRQEREESERKHEERERRREAEEKELEKWRKRFEKYPDAVLDKKIAELRKEPESGTAKDWLPRFEKERARRRDVRRAKPVIRPETVDQAVSMLEEAWRDAEKEDIPDVKRALELVSRIDEWLQETASSDKYDKYFEGLYRTVARQTVGITKDQISGIKAKLYFQGKDDWNRATYLGGHWELGINSLKYAREHLEVMGGKKSLQQTSLHGLQETTTRILKYEAAGYAIVVAAPVVIGAAIEAAPLLTTEAATAAGLRIAPRLMFWAARNPILATEIGTAVVGTAIQVGEDKYLDPFQLIFSLLHIYMAKPGRGTPAPNVPHPEGDPDFVITGAPKVDQQTGKVTASAIEKASGRHFDAEVDITTGLGRITDAKTGQVIGNIDLNTAEIGKQAPASAAPALAAPKPTAPPPADIAPAPTLTAQQGGGQGSGTPTGMLRDVDVPGGGVQLPASHAVFKNKPVANDAAIPAQSQVSKVAVNAPSDVPHAQIAGAARTVTPHQKNVVPVSMATKPPSSNPPGDTGASSGPSAPVPAPKPQGQTPAVHPRVIRRLPPTQAPSPPEVAQPDPQVASPAPSPPEVVPPAPPRAVNRNVIPRAPAEPAPPAPPRAVNQNVIPRTPAQPAQPMPEVAPPPPAPTGSTQSGLSDDFEDAPTLVSPLQPDDSDYEPPRSLVRRSERDTDQNLKIVSGEITEPPSGGGPNQPAPGAAREPARSVASSEPQSAFPEPPVKQPAVSGEPSARPPASKTPGTIERFDFGSLPVPQQYRGARDKVQIFGTQVIKWGAGSAEAQALTTMLRTNPVAARTYIENLRRQGVTSDMAREWADAYRHEHARAEMLTRTRRVPMNRTPESRVALMDLIASLL